MKNLAAKLLEVQKEVGAIKKGSVNPFFKSKYADINSYIDTVKPILNKHGVVLLQPLSYLSDVRTPGTVYWTPEKTSTVEGTQIGQLHTALKTILIDVDSGEKMEEITIIPYATDPQKQGSIITYFRRYALQSMLFLQAEDDDGNGAKSDIKGDNDLDL